MTKPPVELAEKIAQLGRPECYPHAVGRVALIETHMACVFLAGDFAYKLKKPFHRNGIDYGTLAARRLNCLRELRLNRRLAPHVYLDVLPLARTPDGRLTVGGVGEPVDWLLKMRRMPAGLALDRHLPRLQDAVALARDIVGVFRRLISAENIVRWRPGVHVQRLRQKIRGTARQLLRREFDMDASSVHRIASDLHAFALAHVDLLDARAGEGRIVEGHGDLRPEHIYCTAPPTIVDCIEFDRALRLRDPLEELAFLALELERLGYPEFGRRILDEYREQCADQASNTLIHFYQSLNAFVRAKIAVWHIEDPETGPRRHWIACAEDYLGRAMHHIESMQHCGADGA